MPTMAYFKRIRFSKAELLQVLKNAAPNALSELNVPEDARIFVEEDPTDASYMILEFLDPDPGA